MTSIALGDIIEIRKGKKPSSVHEHPLDRTKPCILIDQVRGAAPSSFTSDDKGVEAHPEDLCMVWDGANAGTVGFGVSGYLGSTVARLRIKNRDDWDTEFIGRLLQGKFADLNDAAKGKGATIPHVDKRHLEHLLIPHYPIEQQKRIAAILAQADQLRRKRQHALESLIQLGQAIFIKMFVEGQSDDWPTLLLEQLVDERSGGIRTGPFGSQLLHSEFVDDGVAVLGIDNAVSNQFQWGQRRHITLDKYKDLKRYRVYPGDVIITIMGTCGRCAIVPPEIPLAINTKHLCCISLQRDACVPEYLHSYFLTHPAALEYLRSKSKGAIMDGLNMGIIKAMPVKLPPFRLQQQFVKNLKLIEGQRGATSEAAALSDQLFTSLQHRAYRGELMASSLKEAAA